MSCPNVKKMFSAFRNDLFVERLRKKKACEMLFDSERIALGLSRTDIVYVVDFHTKKNPSSRQAVFTESGLCVYDVDFS